jgi:hypothetical protein
MPHKHFLVPKSYGDLYTLVSDHIEKCRQEYGDKLNVVCLPTSVNPGNQDSLRANFGIFIKKYISGKIILISEKQGQTEVDITYEYPFDTNLRIFRGLNVNSDYQKIKEEIKAAGDDFPDQLIVHTTYNKNESVVEFFVADFGIYYKIRHFTQNLYLELEKKLQNIIDQANQRPWEVIEDEFERKIAELWWKGKSTNEIALMIQGVKKITPKTVLNRIYDLRKEYTPDVVPFDKDRIK